MKTLVSVEKSYIDCFQAVHFSKLMYLSQIGGVKSLSRQRGVLEMHPWALDLLSI